MNDYLKAAIRLHDHVTSTHWDGRAISGPDPIGKINWRITRFIKSYLDWVSWGDRFTYLQAQGYWIKTNLRIFELTGESKYLDIARQCADHIIQMQMPNGVWEHPPLWERKGYISTLETLWACLGLVFIYKQSKDSKYLGPILKGYQGLTQDIGFNHLMDSLAIKYYAHSNSLVPNINTIFLWLAAEIHQATGEEHYLNYTKEVLQFLEYSQLESGEFYYAYDNQPHFQCFQYNAFQFLTLAEYYIIIKDEKSRELLNSLVKFLSIGVARSGSCRFDCYKENPEANYRTAALAAALYLAHQLKFGPYQEISCLAYRRLLSRQNPNGSFDFSDKNYHFLADRRSYPRQQAMILDALLLKSEE
ncbi:MAG: hypothetical protein JW963_02520 [Anaerolineales bacterium]|nr:hypothetical protein [Anaerolineales bacterium]